MRRFTILFSFIPWFVFSALYGNSKHQITEACVIGILLVLILNRKELRKGFVFPWASIIYFALISINGIFDWLPWVEYHPAATINLALAIIVWISLIIKRPFTLQYAREQVPESYWKNPLFVKTSWYLSIAWAILLTISAMPAWFIPQAIYAKSWFWHHGFGYLCILLAFNLNKVLPNIIIGRNFWKQVAKLPPVNSPYLKDGYAPVHEEINIKDLIVEGEIPDNFNGFYLRNGPNPYFTPYTHTYPIDGDGMVHKLSFHNGNVSYQNRFVMTKGLAAEIKAGKALYGGIGLPIRPDPKFVGDEDNKNNASIHVVKWQDKFLALYETSTAYLLDNELNTLGEWQPNGVTPPFLVNAHHRVDPKNGHTFMFCYDVVWEKPYLQVYEFNQQKELIKTIPVNKSRATMIHDLVITQHYVVLFDVPAVFNVAGNDGSEPFFAYKENLPVNIILINRLDYTVKTIDNIPSFFVYHFVNAYEVDNKILVDFIHHKNLEFDPAMKSGSEISTLYRAEIDLVTMSYNHRQLLDIDLEFPVYNLAYTGSIYQYSYLASRTTHNSSFDKLIKYDHVSNSSKVINFGANYEIDEPVFIAKNNPKTEDDGYIGLYLYDKETHKSSFVIYDAITFDKQIAKVRLPVRVPHGLHGSWVKEASDV